MKTTKQRITGALRWAVLNTAVAALIWLAISGSIGAGRLLPALAWYLAICATVIAATDNLKAKLVANGRSIPAWLSHSVGACYIAVLVWSGWWFTAIAFSIGEIAELFIFDESDKETKPNQ